ncbi:uncharacterized protein YjaZ [Bacillus fengqiuensis]|nr:uncharacterized protein YjaZ [Bacillus fengqiuensis]
MPVISTNEWLTHMLKDPRSFEEKLAVYFSEFSSKEMIHLLISHGMFRIGGEPKEQIEAFVKKDLWKKINPHFKKLQRLWNGPDIPVLLFPSDSRNRQIQREFNGKSGVAFSDKLFLFVRENVEEAELFAVLTHEYHHICRLKAMRKKEEELTLLDTLVMEGLAEHAVKEQVGEAYLAPWTKYYSRERAMQYWEKYIYPNRHVKKEERTHDELLYGMRWYPKMVGYNTGYHLVTSYTKSNRLPSAKLMHISSQEIAANSGFKR